MTSYGHGPEVAAMLADWKPKAWAEALADAEHVSIEDKIEWHVAAARPSAG